jgi:excisionase family DNA binding protein
MIIIQLDSEQLKSIIQNSVRKVFNENQTFQKDEKIIGDCWFNLPELCSYHPEKPKKSTVYRWVRERKIPFHKRGKKLAFLKSEIDENIKSGRVKTLSEIEQEAEDFLVNKKQRG